MAKTNAPKKVVELLEKVGLTQDQAMWNCHGTWVMYHKACEKIAAHMKVKFSPPEMVYCNVDKNQAVILVTGEWNNIIEWSYGEATPQNNKNVYPFAMAEKRAKDRVILKLLGFHGDVYTDSEFDDQVQKEAEAKAQRISSSKKIEFKNIEEGKNEVGDGSYSSNNQDDPPPQPTWDDIKKEVETNIRLISNKGYSIEIRKESRLNDLRGDYGVMKQKYGNHEFWKDIHEMYKNAQTQLSL